MSSESNIEIRNRRADSFDKWAFACITLLGMGWIVLAKTSEAIDNQAIIITIPIVLMFVYVFAPYFFKILDIRADRIADNAYYLGFLYTLTSLATALYILGTKENQEQHIQHIITNFGIALSTTIIGVFLRVLIQQWRKDPLEYEEESRVLLSEAVNLFQADVIQASNSFKEFGIRFKQLLDESREDFGKEINSALKDFVKSTEEMSNKNNSLYQSLNKNAEELINTENQLINSINKMVAKIEDIAIPSDLIEKKLNNTLENLNTSLVRFVGNIKEEINSFSSLSENINTISKNIEQSNLQLVQDIKEEINSFSSLSENINTISKNIEQSNLDAHAKSLSERMTTLSESTAKLDETVNNIELKCLAIINSLEESNVKGANKIIEDISDQYKQASSLRQSIQNELEGTAKDMQRVRKEMLELSKFIIDTTK